MDFSDLGYLGHRAEDDGMPVVVYAPNGEVVAHVATTHLGVAVLSELAERYAGQLRAE